MSTPSLFAIFGEKNLDTEFSKNSVKTSCRKFKDISEKKGLIQVVVCTVCYPAVWNKMKMNKILHREASISARAIFQYCH